MSHRQYAVPASGRLVYGDPITTEHSTLIPVSRVRGDGSSAIGMFVVREKGTTWVPVIDADRIATIGVITGLIAATLGSLAVLRKPPWPDNLIRMSAPKRATD
ncbi:hypothetical protein Back2_26510 [Nocardioides baekrokdamisoli]|uniref:Uncharacterized protein n=1 Tax=Nocardioides baekrokdamisoli TaxID=1804624 RepID=A0A3G9J4L4_9ACTN|nr:hypothetical protein [Nocardioides baekrokdamisoli]BBH18364.1 hypothetical protein Back2_26510 [Nocardioides baekrokdamisoli]